MIRVVALLSLFTTLSPIICSGQDGLEPVTEHVLTSQSDWIVTPDSQMIFVSNEAMLPHASNELLDWREFDGSHLMRQGRNPQGRTPSFGPLPLVAQQTCAHRARMSRSETLIGADSLVVRGQNADGQSGSGGGGNLTSQANDPTAALIQFNVQNFFTTDSYEATGHGYQLGLLPVIPIQQEILGFDRVITRPSIPVFGPSIDPLGPVGSESGLGDIFVTNLLIKTESWGAWGLGPSINFPTATDPALGSREWQLAPSAVVVMPSADKKWLFGGLLLAPFSMQSNAKSLSLQPIVVRFLPDNWYVGNGFQVCNWQTSNGNFNVPLTFRVGRVFKEVKPLPLNISMQAGYTPEEWHQGPAAKWQFLFNVTILIPQG